MPRCALALALAAAASPLAAQATPASPPRAIPPVAAQLAAAVAPLPDSLRAGAAVLGYAPDGKLVSLRTGTNAMVCLADDPAREGFHTACYHKDLEPFMARGRALREQGSKRAAVDSIREAEIRAHTLPFPTQPTTLYELFGKDDGWDATTGAVRKAEPMWAVYIPYATEASTGLQMRPVAGGGPWIMFPGKPWAHIMIVPERPGR